MLLKYWDNIKKLYLYSNWKYQIYFLNHPFTTPAPASIKIFIPCF